MLVTAEATSSKSTSAPTSAAAAAAATVATSAASEVATQKRENMRKRCDGGSDCCKNCCCWATDDAYNLTAFDQIDGAWPIGHPLPLPAWSQRRPLPKVVEKVWQYEDLAALIEVTLHHLLEETHYDTVHNFIDFYASYKQQVAEKQDTITAAMNVVTLNTSNGSIETNTTADTTLRSFFHGYTPPVNRRHHMCVSLAMELVTRLTAMLPDIARHLYIVSCEEAVESAEPYIEHCEEASIDQAIYSLEKEHALIAMRIQVAGRDGIMILDPGYHVARAVTVMRDQCYPHTGWFTQSDEPHCKREYLYSYSVHSANFIEWTERVTRGGQQTHGLSLVFVERPYRTAIDVTVRRNLVYNFRSLLARDAKGRVCAGLYFPVVANGADNAQLTLFYDGPNSTSVKVKQKFSTFRGAIDDVSGVSSSSSSSNGDNSSCTSSCGRTLPDAVRSHLEHLAPQLRMDVPSLGGLLNQLATVMADNDFVQQTLAIDYTITEMSADN